MEKITPVNVWNNIERVWVWRLDFVFEGQTIVGIHHSDMEDAINEIDWLCNKLQRYKKELEMVYGKTQTISHRSMIGTYVYLIKCLKTGKYKIGRSVNPIFREKTLSAESPEIETIFVSPLTTLRSEKELHKKFKGKRIRGEWFSLNESDVEQIRRWEYGIA